MKITPSKRLSRNEGNVNESFEDIFLHSFDLQSKIKLKQNRNPKTIQTEKKIS